VASFPAGAEGSRFTHHRGSSEAFPSRRGWPGTDVGAIAPLDDQLCAPKDTEMLRHCRPGDVVESGGDVGCGHLHGPDQAEDLSAPGSAKALKAALTDPSMLVRAPEADRTRNSLQAG